MKSEPIKDPRRIGKHVAAVLDMLREGGAEDIEVTKSKHLVVRFRLAGQSWATTMPCTPRDQDVAVVLQTQRLRRMFGAVLRERAA